MPIEFAFTHPLIVGMNSAAYGAAFRLIHHFWVTDCQPLPESDYAKFLIARAHKPTWAANRAAIQELLSELLPELAKARAVYAKKSSILDALRDRGIAAKREKKLAKAMDSPRLIHDANVSRPSAEVRARKVTAAVPGSAPSGTFRD